MLIGEFTHTLDDKRRVSLPAKFRRQLGSTVVLTRGLDNCIFCYPRAEWKTIMDKLGSLSIGQADSRGLNRFMLSGAREADIDSSGRVLIPDFLAEFADLEGSAVLAGVGNRIEIWSEDAWNDYKHQIESEADDLAEKLGEVGMI